MAVGASARLPLGQSRAIAVSNRSGRGRREDRDRVLDRPGILRAFERLDRKLEALRLRAVVHLAGSAPLLLDGSRAGLTRDVDALRIEHAGRQEEFASAVRETAREMGVAPNWLNRDVSLVPGMPPRPDGDERTVYEGRYLTAIAASDRQLLAMKFRAHRQQDWDDIRILTGKVGASTFEQVRDIHDRCFPHSPYSEFPDIAKEYLGRELPRLLAELGRNAQEAGSEPEPPRSR